MATDISVIMTAHNAAGTIAEAISSVQQQSFGNWELIVVDDASTDATASIVDAIRDPRIRLIKSPQQLGAAGSRQLGTQAAHATCLNYLDADDRLLPHALRTLHSHAQTQPQAVVIYANYRRLTADGKPLGLRQHTRKMARPSGDVLRDFLRQNHMVNGGLALVKKDAVDAVGGWPVHLRTAEDWALWVLLATQGPFHHVPNEIVLEYRHSPAGLSQTVATTLERKQQAIKWIYAHPLVQAKIPPAERAPLKRQTEAQARCLLACQQIRRHHWRPALPQLMEACGHAPAQSPRYLAQAALAAAEALTCRTPQASGPAAR